jgi:hypothetical protein
LGNEREQAELSAVNTDAEAEVLLSRYLSGAYVQYSQPAWARTEKSFLMTVNDNWSEVASGLSGGVLHCGTQTIDLEVLQGPEPAGAVPIVVMKKAHDVGPALRQGLSALADAAAWTQLAVRSRVAGTTVLSALHQDQDEVIEIDLKSARGAVELLRWRMSDNQANREEALRHVLRFVTANATALPAAQTVKTLAERQYIALARDRAAQVFRSITEAQRATGELLENASESLSKLVEDTTTTASATIAAVIGVVALIVQNNNLLPGWLILAAAVVAVGGVAAVVASRWGRITDQQEAADRLQQRLERDPLLPAEDHSAMEELITEFDLAKRAKGARRRILVLGAAASAVALSAAGWLVWRQASTSSPPSSTSTTTAAPSVIRPSVGRR